MPTATSLSQFTFHNIGPLTTTYTVPASCASTSNIGVALASMPLSPIFATDCTSHNYGNCLPSTAKATSTVAFNDPLIAWQASYYSPGLFCPAGWATVGIAARSGDGPVSTTGVFSPSSTVSAVISNDIFNNAQNVLLQILDPSETAVLCCPSSMTGAGGACYSAVPSYTVTSGCVRIFPQDALAQITTTFLYEGATVSGVVESETGTDPITSIRTFVLTDPTLYIGVDASPLLTLIHQPSDIVKTSSNAAEALGSVPGSWNHISAIFGVWVIGMAAGAGLIRPW